MLAEAVELPVTPVETLFAESHRGLVERSVGPGAAHATASGKIFLAHDAALADEYLAAVRLPGYTDRTVTDHDRLAAELESVRDRGIATARGEYLPDLSSIAIPVCGAGRRVVAAVAIGGYDMEPMKESFERLVRQEAAHISGTYSRTRRHRLRQIASRGANRIVAAPRRLIYPRIHV
jgi:hypothetical protein